MKKLIKLWRNFWLGGDSCHDACARCGYCPAKGAVEMTSEGSYVWKEFVPEMELGQGDLLNQSFFSKKND